MHKFLWNLPTKIVYDPGELDRLGDVCKEYGRKAFPTTYRQKAASAWILDESIASMGKAGIKMLRFAGQIYNPGRLWIG